MINTLNFRNQKKIKSKEKKKHRASRKMHKHNQKTIKLINLKTGMYSFVVVVI